MTNKTSWIVFSAVAILIIAGVVIFYVAYSPTEPVSNLNITNSVNRVYSNTNSFGNANVVVSTNGNANRVVANSNAVVNTNTVVEETPIGEPTAPAELTKVDDFVTLSADSAATIDATYRVGSGPLVGTIYAGKDLYLVDLRPDGPSFYPLYFRFVKDGSQLTLLALQSDDPTYSLDPASYTADQTTVVASLNYPTTLTGENSRQMLELDPRVNALFDPTGLREVFRHSTYGVAYTNTDPDQGNFYGRNGFYFKAPDGTVRVYTYKSDFLGTDDTARITWTDGSKNYNAYVFHDIGGCGAVNYSAVMTDLSVDADLTQIGVSSQGDKIYGLKDDQHTLLRGVYDTYSAQHSTDSATPSAYADFLARKPLIFFRDPFDRLLKGTNSEFQPLAECGKPVIYLYPEKTTSVSVKVEPTGGLSVSEPAYNSGWSVIARPDGSLTELSSGQSYSYLFWEGRSKSLYRQPDRGWTVAQADVPAFLTDKLNRLGLNEKEAADFLEFWLPRMQSAPYYFVSFLGNREMDTLAPLTVDPKPDTVIRVLMDFQPLTQPIESRPYQIKTPERQGFTVVEWGGVRR